MQFSLSSSAIYYHYFDCTIFTILVSRWTELESVAQLQAKERVGRSKTVQLSGSNGCRRRCGESSSDVREPLGVDVVVKTSGKPFPVVLVSGFGIRDRVRFSRIVPDWFRDLITLVQSTCLPVLLNLVQTGFGSGFWWYLIQGMIIKFILWEPDKELYISCLSYASIAIRYTPGIRADYAKD